MSVWIRLEADLILEVVLEPLKGGQSIDRLEKVSLPFG